MKKPLKFADPRELFSTRTQFKPSGRSTLISGRSRSTSFHFPAINCMRPKGIAALYVNRKTRFNPYLIGGGQENKRRGGTENTASIVALGKAAELALSAMQEENSRVKALRDRFEQGLFETVSSVQLNGHRAHRLPNTSNLAIEGIDSEGMLMLLDQRGICCSAGSACTAGSLEPSHVLKAMGYSNERARGSLRFSFSRFNSETEVGQALQIVANAIERLRSMNRGFLAA